MKRLLLIIYLLAPSLYAQNRAFDPETSDGQLFQYAEFVKTNESNFQIEDILDNDQLEFSELKSQNHDFGFTSDTHWVRFKLQNSSDQNKTYYLETARPVTDIVNLYHVDSEITKHSNGDQIPLEEHDLNHRQVIFKIKLKPKSQQQFYVQLKSDGEAINLPLNLYTQTSFLKENYKQQLFLGLFYGVLFLAGVIYLFFYKSLKNKAFLYYGLYVFSIALMQATLDGFIFQYIFPNGGYINSRMVLITALASNFYLLKYCEHFLKISKYSNYLSKAYNVIYAALLILGIMIFLSPKTLELAYPLSNLNGLLSLLLIVTTVVYMRFRRIKVDPFFSFGILFLVVGLLGFVMNNLGALPSNFYTLNSSKFGTGLEVVFLSLSMTNLIRNLREDNEKSQALALKKSEEISELKSYFMSNISHELRTPINAIMGVVDSELSNSDDKASRKSYQMIKNASLSLLSSVNDVLDFERIEKNELKLREEKFNPSLILNQISNNWKSEATKKGLKYSFEMDTEIPTKVSGDSDRFAQIINNILANAVKFTNIGHVKMKLKCMRQANEISRFYFQISDTGVGMDNTNKDDMFDSFNQMRLSHNRAHGGIGLGLTIVKHLVDLFEGKITIESKKHKGTDVFLELPLKELVKSNSEEVSTAFKNDPINILIVEDNKMNQIVMRKLLGSLPNASFSVVNNGQEAIDALKAQVYDIILMDLQMPIMDGYEATELIRSGNLGKAIGKIPIIAVTADTMESTRKRVLELGMDDYITKPVKKELLFEKIRSCSATYKLSVA